MNSSGRNPLRINAFEMLRRPGTQKAVRLGVAPSALELEDPRLVEDREIEIALDCESLSDGIVVHGEVSFAFRGECRRCLRPIEGRVDAAVQELFQVELTDPDAFPIEGDFVDLGPVVREIVLLELPDGPLCRIDCAGLCARCGQDLNHASCSCPKDSIDSRWAALETLRDSLPE